MSEADKMRQKSLVYKEKLKRERQKNRERKKRKAIKKIQTDIKTSVRNGDLKTISVFCTMDVFKIKQYIYDYFSSKGYQVEIVTDDFPYRTTMINISWEEQNKDE